MDAILDKKKSLPDGEYLVQLRLKYADAPDDSYLDIIELLTVTNKYVKGENTLTFEWQYDWWEGEDDVYIVGFAAIDDIDLSVSFPFGDE